jgi:hypothetical protein
MHNEVVEADWRGAVFEDQLAYAAGFLSPVVPKEERSAAAEYGPSCWRIDIPDISVVYDEPFEGLVVVLAFERIPPADSNDFNDAIVEFYSRLRVSL